MSLEFLVLKKFKKHTTIVVSMKKNIYTRPDPITDHCYRFF